MTTHPRDRRIDDDETAPADRIPQLRLVRSSDCDRRDDTLDDPPMTILAW